MQVQNTTIYPAGWGGEIKVNSKFKWYSESSWQFYHVYEEEVTIIYCKGIYWRSRLFLRHCITTNSCWVISRKSFKDLLPIIFCSLLFLFLQFREILRPHMISKCSWRGWKSGNLLGMRQQKIPQLLPWGLKNLLSVMRVCTTRAVLFSLVTFKRWPKAWKSSNWTLRASPLP